MLVGKECYYKDHQNNRDLYISLHPIFDMDHRNNSVLLHSIENLQDIDMYPSDTRAFVEHHTNANSYSMILHRVNTVVLSLSAVLSSKRVHLERESNANIFATKSIDFRYLPIPPANTNKTTAKANAVCHRRERQVCLLANCERYDFRCNLSFNNST